MKRLSWANFILGLWLIVAPFAIHYGDINVTMWNNVIVGTVVAIFAIYRALESSNLQPLQHRHSAQ
jgi:hypothetical protein